MTMEVKPFDPALWPPEILRTAREDFSGLTDEWLVYQVLAASGGWGFMALRDGEPIAAAGAWLVWPGVAQVWAVLREAAPEVLAVVLRRLKRGLPEFCQVHKLRRLQAIVDPNGKNCRLAGYLGLRPEGRMRGYGMDGRDWLLYGKVVD